MKSSPKTKLHLAIVYLYLIVVFTSGASAAWYTAPNSVSHQTADNTASEKIGLSQE